MREIDRLSLIVDELLILSRAGEHELPGERVDLGRRRRRAAERWRGTAAERGDRARVARRRRRAAGWCARPDLDRSIDALVENALLYSPAGSTVTIAAAPGRIEVLDRGPGLAAARRRRSSSASAAAAPASAARAGPGSACRSRAS